MVNGVLSGLYIAVENVDGQFTKYRFPDGGNGNLFKEIWPSPTVNKDWAQSQLRTNDKPEDNPDVSEFLQFKETIAQTTVDTFESGMQGMLNLDNMVRHLVMDRAIKNGDGIMGFYATETSHDFYWYHDDGAANLFRLVPWDLDNTIQEFDIFMDPKGWCSAIPVPDWNETPLNCEARHVCTSEEVLLMPPRCDHFVDMLAQTQWNKFVAAGNELLQDVFSYTNMKAKITAWASQIEETVAEDPLMDEDQWQSDVAALRVTMKNAISDFQEHLDKGLIEEIAIEHLDESTLTVSIEAGPLRPDIINNFEVESGTEGELTSVMYPYTSEGTDISLQWHTDAPSWKVAI
jgi:spore coat protein CotH